MGTAPRKTQPVTPSGLDSIGQIAISVRELPRAIQFYRDILGLPFLFEASGMAFFDCGGVRLMLSVSESAESAYNSIVYYRTRDIHEATARLTRNKVPFDAPPRMIAKMSDHELWMAFLRDSEGNLLALMSEVR